MIHGFDIDGVVTKPEALVKSIAKEFPGFEYHHLADYSIAKSLLKSGFIKSIEEFREKDFFLEHNKDILAEAEIAEGFLDYIERIKNHEKHFITARDNGLAEFTERLFHRCGIPYLNVHHVGSTDKLGLVSELQVVQFYEDNLDTALTVGKLGTVNVILVDTNYNQMPVLPYKTIRRIKNWGEL